MPRPRHSLDSMEGRVCATCKIYKTKSEYHPSGTTWNLMRSHCKECRSIEKKRRKGIPELHEKKLQENRDYRKKVKEDIIEHYTRGRMKCKFCGISDMEVLTLDHINGKGRKHREDIGGSGVFYNWIIRENFPEGFQVLCRNCNTIKMHENKEFAYKTATIN